MGNLPTIQHAIDAARDGDTIELANGVFTGTGNCDVTFRGKAVIVRSRSDDPLTCVIDVQGSDLHEARAFLFDSGEDQASVVQGVTITGLHPSRLIDLSRRRWGPLS